MKLVPTIASPAKLPIKRLTKGQQEWRQFAERYRENLAFKVQVKWLLRQSDKSIIRITS